MTDLEIFDKYQKTYDVVLEEAKFFFDLENIIKASGRSDVNIGYFNKFRADDMEIFVEDKYYSYVVEDFHIIALNLSRWEIKEIPKSIGLLSKLQYLSLANLGLEKLPNSIKTLHNLIYINLSGNKFKDIPYWLNSFSKRKNARKYIKEGVNPEEAIILGLLELLKGENLEKADSTNDIVQMEFAAHYKINNYGNIIGIYINDEKVSIGTFPQLLCTLKFLQELELSNSSIEIIPNCIGELQSLRYLDLSFNRIKFIPKSLNKLRSLEYMNLDDNDIPEKTLLELRWYKFGQKFLDERKYDKVIEECLITLETYPKNKFAWFHLGIAYKEQEEFAKAKEAFQKFLEIDPFSSIVWSILSDIFNHYGEYSKAIDALKRALDIEQDIALLWSNLGFNYKKLGKYDNAIEAYLHSLEIEPNNKNVWKDLASIYRDKGQYMKAIEADEHSYNIELNSDNKNE